MATVRTEPRSLALRVFLLRIRLLAVRSLLRGVVALRSFIRRQRARSAAGLDPADIRVDPWASVPIGQFGLLLPVLIVAASAVTGFMMGRQYERGNLVPSPTAEVVAKNSASRDNGEEVDLALKGEDPNAPTEATQAKPATSHVVVLNPETADQKENSKPRASAQVRIPSTTRPAGNVSRRDVTASDDRPSTSHRPMQGYRDLRDYMLRQ